MDKDVKHVLVFQRSIDQTASERFGGFRQLDIGQPPLQDDLGGVACAVNLVQYLKCDNASLMAGLHDYRSPVGRVLCACVGVGDVLNVHVYRLNIHTGDVLDGTSNTFAVGERSAQYGFSTWTGYAEGGDEALARILGVADHPPNSKRGHLDDFSSQHPAGTNFVFVDGSVRLIAETIDLTTYRSLATRAGGEVVTE